MGGEGGSGGRERDGGEVGEGVGGEGGREGGSEGGPSLPPPTLRNITSSNVER